jgi:hypothetical protein
MTEEELLATPGLQAVAVETEVKDLVPTGLRCVAAGKHIHLDKPAGESLADFKRLLDDAARQRLTVQLGYMLRLQYRVPALLRVGTRRRARRRLLDRRGDEQSRRPRRAKGTDACIVEVRCSSLAAT